MDLDKLKDLIKFLKDTDITEVSIETEGSKVKLKREHLMTQFELSGVPMASPSQGAAEAPKAPHAGSAEAEDDSGRLITVTAPLVGTFYRSSSPEASHYVEPGDKLRKGQVICIIEAMKLMN